VGGSLKYGTLVFWNAFIILDLEQWFPSKLILKTHPQPLSPKIQFQQSDVEPKNMEFIFVCEYLHPQMTHQVYLI
jgi:hypothetical protein